MGYGFYFIGNRPCGYNVAATCDKHDCGTEIDRGMGFLCGQSPKRPFIDGDPGCGMYFCDKHLGGIGDRGGCPHSRQQKMWGETLSCMAMVKQGGTDHYCLTRVGHDEPHAWIVGGTVQQ